MSDADYLDFFKRYKNSSACKGENPVKCCTISFAVFSLQKMLVTLHADTVVGFTLFCAGGAI